MLHQFMLSSCHMSSQLFHADPVDMDAVTRELSAALKQYDEQAAGPTKYR